MLAQLIFILSIFLLGFALKSIAISLSQAFSVDNYRFRFEESHTIIQLKDLYEEVSIYYQEQKKEEAKKLLEDIEKRINALN